MWYNHGVAFMYSDIGESNSEHGIHLPGCLKPLGMRSILSPPHDQRRSQPLDGLMSHPWSDSSRVHSALKAR